ncbi:hypothetical protein EW146_g6019 [Bondarzewia mesenterica]|uniref:GATA-type domain-containing protein n=1 Tax=Bondarzewia mesenterica TaxID=1095465 RepID=A0A4S4LVH5_9AGAM|nr:hypothetical protein EW146_g6019 [Bondarzewia mesenterica]
MSYTLSSVDALAAAVTRCRRPGACVRASREVCSAHRRPRAPEKRTPPVPGPWAQSIVFAWKKTVQVMDAGDARGVATALTGTYVSGADLTVARLARLPGTEEEPRGRRLQKRETLGPSGTRDAQAYVMDPDLLLQNRTSPAPLSPRPSRPRYSLLSLYFIFSFLVFILALPPSIVAHIPPPQLAWTPSTLTPTPPTPTRPPPALPPLAQTTSPPSPTPPAHFKVEMDPVRNIFADPLSDDHTVAPENVSMWPGVHAASLPFHASRGSLLQELTCTFTTTTSRPSPRTGILPPHRVDVFHPDSATFRRATYPYVRQDRDDAVQYPHATFIPQDSEPIMDPFASRSDTLYGEPMSMVDHSPQLISLGPDPSLLSNRLDLSASLTSSPASSYHDFDRMDHHIKMEETAPVIVPSQTCLYRPPSSGSIHPVSYLSPHTGLPVQHTDDAASKETQYLRRRCFNCSQTEPPSWRRSTLNPGKIVCNKCGLYERTHLRPRPLRFDELRTGNKSRKQSKAGSGSPASKVASLVKKEPDGDMVMSRRASVSSTSSVHSSSDWDDSVSVYSSSGSAPPSSYNSPATTSFSLPLESRSSQSPPLGPRDGGIRLPNAPLSDIASFQSGQTSPRRSAMALDYGSPASVEAEMLSRRASLPVDVSGVSQSMSEVTGWQTVPMTDISSGQAQGNKMAVLA